MAKSVYELKIFISMCILKLVSYNKEKAKLQNVLSSQAVSTTAWCADYTEGLTGYVGTIEIGREREKGMNIMPGYGGASTYNQSRDGQLMPLLAQDPAATYYNLAMLPGTQKWKPMYRYATITEIDYDEDNCSISLPAVTSSQQGLNINQAASFAGVSISYMDCDSDAFEVGDEVIVKFENYDIESPVVIGFKDTPAECCFLEPWDGPLFTTRRAWIDEYAYNYQVEAGGGGWVTKSQSAFVLSISTGALVISKTATTASELGDSNEYGDLFASGSLAISYPDNPATNGGIMPDVILHEAAQIRATINSLSFTCAEWPEAVVTSYFSIGVGGYAAGTEDPYFFSVFFMSESPLGNYYTTSFATVKAQGHWCNSPAHSYQLTFEKGGVYGISADPDYTHYYAYVPTTHTDWIEFPFEIDVCFVQIFAYVDGYGWYDLDDDGMLDTRRTVIPGINVSIDKIEIC